MKKILTLCCVSMSCIVSANEITLIRSNKVISQKETITCQGNVVIVYCNRVITADKIIYSKKDKSINATGSIIIKDEKNNVYFADEFFANKGFQSGKAKNIKIIMDDRSRLAATHCTIKNGKYYLDNVVYSPCYECSFNNEITWKIKSKHVVCDPDDEIQYEDAIFELYGTPIINTPYFMHESPKVKRKSGFLPPKIETSSSNGFSIVAPYLWAISNSQEIIFKPLITTKAGVIAWAEYNLRFNQGELSIDTSVTNTHSINNIKPEDNLSEEKITKIKHNNYRGHFFAKINYDINNTWRAGADVKLVSDMDYLKRFALLPDPGKTLESNVRLEGFDNDNYTLVKCAKFQTENYEAIPRVLPIFERNYYKKLFGGVLGVDIMGMNLDFCNSRSAQKITTNVSWNKEFELMCGQLLDFNAVVSGRALRVKEKTHSQYNSEAGINPQISCIWSWPLVTSLKELKNIITPMCGVVFDENKKLFDIFEHPFSELTALNLFAGNRSVSMYDIDSGSRVCYGIRTSGYFSGRNVYQFIVGQSTELTNPQKYNEESGLKHKCSNTIFGLDIFCNKNIALVSRGSYNHHNKRWSKIEAGIEYQYKKFDFNTMLFNGRHCFYDPFDDRVFEKSDEIEVRRYKGASFDFGYQATPKIKLFTGFTIGNKEPKDLQKPQPDSGRCKMLSQRIGIDYKNECAELRGEFIISKHHSGDLKPEKTIRLSVHLKNLGI